MNKQILKKIIEKAIKRGWNVFGLIDSIFERQIKDFAKDENDESDDLMLVIVTSNGARYYSVNDIIFNHDFAKAFWSDTYKRKVIICSNKKCSRKLVWALEDNYYNLKDCPYCSACGNKMHIEKQERFIHRWHHQLQQLVLEEDPIKYLSEFL